MPDLVPQKPVFDSLIGNFSVVSCYLEQVTHFTDKTFLSKTNDKFRISLDFTNRILDTKKTEKFEHDYFAKKWFVGGTGKKPYNCRGWVPYNFCEDCGQIYLVAGNCNSGKCPDCVDKWRYKRSRTVNNRLLGFKIENKCRLIHCTVSIHPEMYEKFRSINSINKLVKNEIYPLLESKGVHGGWFVFHPFRVIESKKKEIYEHFKDYNLDKSLGKFGLWKVISKLKNWRDFVYWSPHFHIIGACSWVENGSAEDDFIFKRIGDLNTADDLVKCSMYLLSHTGLYDNNESKSHSVKWFGCCSNAKWSLAKCSMYTIDAVKRAIKQSMNDFAEKEGTVYGRCKNCGGKLVSMVHAMDYLDRFSNNTQHRLKYAYAWVSGDIPPPDLSTILEVIGFNELNNSRFEKPFRLNVDKRPFVNGIMKRKRLIGMKKKYEDLRIKYGDEVD